MQGKPVKDYFITHNDTEYAGCHLLIDLWQAKNLTDLALVESSLRQCVVACRATLLHIHLHHFSDSGGISGVAVLAESHISVHTWPERDYAAFDIFMCGDTEPNNAIAILKEAFIPEKCQVKTLYRGEVS
ncbi:S-adenosylmethionine decarboxylase proenzyme, prokaryotic class 1B [hydrothermal vent metagenome]|uniref:S-adenosylmethionine decarboxylase proenzyme, prokaryotic class 1B n=1 Tax=hydrothermal vent metagenome TaxID=652676 RepID=A0A3B1A7R4_9ZZZZ